MKKNLSLFSLFLLATACGPRVEPLDDKPMFTAESKVVTVYTTSDSANLRLSQTGNKNFEAAAQAQESEIAVFVNPEKEFQTFMGIGGAITDASAEVFAKLSPAKQEEFMKACYDTTGIGYSLLRTTIHSSDFSSNSYTYIEEGDKELKTFSIAHDQQFRIPMIKKAIETAGGKITTYASPWTPPAFMKDNKDMLKGGKLLPDYYQSWANYFTKFVKAYEAEKIPIWGITVQNEPMAAQKWESCVYTSEEERDFLKNHLGPTMEKEGLQDKKIVVWDHNRDLLTQRANTIFSDPKAARYAWGIGFHWYEPWSGGDPMYDNVRTVQESFPTKNILFTEGCIDKFDTSGYQSWPNAEKFGQSMIHDFNNGTVGWTFWNVLLDEKGGPNHVGNYCFAPIHGDTRTGELIYTPTYYYIGHFSKFIRPNAKRISTSTSRSQLIATSFISSDRTKIITVVLNQSVHALKYKLYIGKMAVEETIPAHGIQTLIY